MSFDDLLKKYDELPPENLESSRILDEMAVCAKTFDQWRNVYYRSPHGSVFERTAFLQMATWARTFGQWLNVYQEPMQYETVSSVAMQQMIKFADDPKDVDWTKSESSKKAVKMFRWKKIYMICPRGSEVEAQAIRRILKLMAEAKQAELDKPKDLSSSKI